jgi:hypothetical protein
MYVIIQSRICATIELRSLNLLSNTPLEIMLLEQGKAPPTWACSMISASPWLACKLWCSSGGQLACLAARVGL